MSLPFDESPEPEEGYGVHVPPIALAFIDWSKAPATNDRKAKIGHGLGLQATIVKSFDEETGRRKFFHGTGDGKFPLAQLAIEVDNWVVRFHEEGGKGEDNVLAVRLIADHTNSLDSAKNRNTFVINAEDEQLQAPLSHLVWHVEQKGVFYDTKEMQFNGAGFLKMLIEDGEEEEEKDPRTGSGGLIKFSELESGPKATALALFVGKNALITDGSQYASFAEILKFTEAGGSVAASGVVRKKGQLAMNAEGPFKYDDEKIVGLPALASAPAGADDSDADEERPVYFFEGSPGGKKIEFAKDPNSNQPAVTRGSHPRIAGYVKTKSQDPYTGGGGSGGDGDCPKNQYDETDDDEDPNNQNNTDPENSDEGGDGNGNADGAANGPKMGPDLASVDDAVWFNYAGKWIHP